MILSFLLALSLLYRYTVPCCQLTRWVLRMELIQEEDVFVHHKGMRSTWISESITIKSSYRCSGLYIKMVVRSPVLYALRIQRTVDRAQIMRQGDWMTVRRSLSDEGYVFQAANRYDAFLYWKAIDPVLISLVEAPSFCRAQSASVILDQNSQSFSFDLSGFL